MAAAQPNALKSLRVPLVGTFLNRSGSLNKDQRFVNCFPESVKAPINDQKKIYLYQRPGLTPIATISTTKVPRGIRYWNGYYYTVYGNTLYKTTTGGVTTALVLKKGDGTTIANLTTSTGEVAFEVGTIVAGNVLVMADGDFVYVIEADDTVTQVPLTLNTWASGTAYAAGARVKPTTATGYYYEALDAGTSDTTEPDWPIFIGETIVDNDITWEAKGYLNDAGAWQANYDYVVGQQISVTVGGKNYLFGISVAGQSGATAPDWSISIGESTIDNEITWTCLGEFKDDAPPKMNIPSFAFMDGYLFLILRKADGSDSADIYNSDVDNPFSWNPVNFIVAEQFPDNLQALARQNNMLVAFGDTSTEFFYDAGNAAGTPLARNTSYTLQVGIASPNALYQNEKFCCFVGQSQSGGRAVWMLDGFVPKKISDEYIERQLDQLTHAEIMAVSGYGLRTNGHLFFVINLGSAYDYSLVYDIEERMWWESTGVGALQMTDDDSGMAVLQHATNGKIYHVDPTVGTDDGVPIEMEVYTQKYDFDTMNLKSMQSINVVCDQVGTNTTMQLRWSDDDYRTWSDWRTLNFNPRAYFVNLGSFRRRAFNLKYTGGLPARFEAFEFDLRLWKA